MQKTPVSDDKTPHEFWDNISEYEVDPVWRQASDSPAYRDYRERFESARERKHVPPFPICIEIEATYYCNLQCPFCPRVVNVGERDSKHMHPELWTKILEECRENGLSAILMDHEAESLMNPKIFEMIGQAKAAGIIDIWMHTNANLLTPERSEQLIAAGLTKINFSLDAITEPVYNVLRVGGNFEKAMKNVAEFLRLKLAKGAHHIRTRVSFVEQKENIHQRKGFFDRWNGVPGLNLIAFQGCIPFLDFEHPDEDSKLTEPQLEEKYADAEPFHCSLPWEMPIIDIEGNVIPCGSPIREHSKDFILGNLNKGDTIKSCWNGDKMKALREIHEKGEFYKNPVCRVCVKGLRRSEAERAALRAQLEPDAVPG